jgi:hypothetical protein
MFLHPGQGLDRGAAVYKLFIARLIEIMALVWLPMIIATASLFLKR